MESVSYSQKWIAGKPSMASMVIGFWPDTKYDKLNGKVNEVIR